MKPLITLSIPVYNEEGNIPQLIERIEAVADQCADQYAFEFLFTDNASSDETFAMLAEAALKDPRIRVLRLSRNFGYQASILTNYLNAKGDAVIQLDADLQDPPDLIPKFLKKWRQGYKVVYGIRRQRDNDALYSVFRKIFYRLITRMTPYPIPKDAGDFRLIDRTIVECLRGCRDHAPYIRGLIASFGFAQTGIPYSRQARNAGKSKFNFLKVLNLAIDGFCSQTTMPLHLITLLGFLITILSALAFIVFFILYFFTSVGETMPGYTSTLLISLFGVGVQSVFLGILGEYMGRIYNNVRQTPFTLVEQRIEPTEEAGSSKVFGVPEPHAVPLSS